MKDFYTLIFIFFISGLFFYLGTVFASESCEVCPSVVCEEASSIVTCPVCDNIKDYNFTCVFEKPTTETYWVNVLPSKQCAGVKISSMIELTNTESTGSMRPTIFGGDVLLAVKYNRNKELVLGDIVVTKTGTAHRIVALNDDTEVYYLRGDNNFKPDFFGIDYEDTEYVVCGVIRGTTQ